MATHAQNIANLRNATYGEQVRGSMIELFEEDYNLVKDGVGVGTVISSASDPTTGFSDGAVYINSNTWQLFKLEGTAWSLKGTIQGTQGESVTGAVDNGDGTFYLTLSDGSRTGDIATIQGLQGPQGPQGPTGSAGPQGRSVTSIQMTGTGKQHPIIATYSDSTTETVGIVQDGADGSGTGDMSKSTYDPNDHGYVDKAAGVTDGTNVLTYANINGKANAATTLSGYGITDAYTKTETDNKFMQLPAAAVTNGKVATANGSGGFTWETPASGVTTYAALSDVNPAGIADGTYMKYDNSSSKWVADTGLKNKVQNLDSNGKIAYSNVTGTPTIPTVNSGSLGIQKGNTINYFYANQNGSATVELDDWAATATVSSGGTITFTGVNDTNNDGYDVYVQVTSSSINKAPYAKLTTISGDGTSSMSLTYETDADSGATAKLRRLK